MKRRGGAKRGYVGGPNEYTTSSKCNVSSSLRSDVCAFVFAHLLQQNPDEGHLSHAAIPYLRVVLKSEWAAAVVEIPLTIGFGDLLGTGGFDVVEDAE